MPSFFFKSGVIMPVDVPTSVVNWQQQPAVVLDELPSATVPGNAVVTLVGLPPPDSPIEVPTLILGQPTLNGTIYTGQSFAKETIEKKTTCLSVSLRRMGTKRKVPSATEAIETETDRNMLLINKLIIDAPELEAICALDGKIRAYLRSKSLPGEALQRGCYLMSLATIATVYEQLEEFSKQRKGLVDKYCAVYPAKVAEAEVRLGKLFSQRDYIPAESVGKAFSMEWFILSSVSTPDNLKDVSNSIFKKEMDKVAAKCQDVIQQVEVGLVEYIDSFTTHLIDALSMKDDGKPKIFKAPSITNFREFLKQLPGMNITNNEKLQALGEKAAAIMEGVDPLVLRKDMTVRQKLQDSLKSLKEVDLAPMLQDQPTRRMKFDLPEESK